MAQNQLSINKGGHMHNSHATSTKSTYCYKSTCHNKLTYQRSLYHPQFIKKNHAACNNKSTCCDDLSTCDNKSTCCDDLSTCDNKSTCCDDLWL